MANTWIENTKETRPEPGRLISYITKGGAFGSGIVYHIYGELTEDSRKDLEDIAKRWGCSLSEMMDATLHVNNGFGTEKHPEVDRDILFYQYVTIPTKILTRIPKLRKGSTVALYWADKLARGETS